MIRDGRAVCEGHVARGAGLAAAAATYAYVARQLIELEARGLPLRTWRFEDFARRRRRASAPRSTTSAASTAPRPPASACRTRSGSCSTRRQGRRHAQDRALLPLRGDGPAHARRRQRRRAGADAGRGARRDHRALRARCSRSSAISRAIAAAELPKAAAVAAAGPAAMTPGLAKRSRRDYRGGRGAGQSGPRPAGRGGAASLSRAARLPDRVNGSTGLPARAIRAAPPAGRAGAPCRTAAGPGRALGADPLRFPAAGDAALPRRPW